MQKLRIEDTRLDTNRSGYFEIRWTEVGEDGTPRTRTYSCRTKDRALAEDIRRTWLSAAGAVSKRAFDAVVGDLVDAYLAGHVDLNGITDSQRWSLKPVRALLGRHTVAELDTGALAKYRATRAKMVKDGTIRRELGALRAVLQWAVDHDELARDTILPKIGLPPASEAREQYLTEFEERRMWALAEGLALDRGRPLRERRLGMFVCLALGTGARSAAIEGLTWDRVDFGAGLIDMREPGRRVSKKKRVAVPIGKRLAPVLMAWAAATTKGGVGVANIGPVLMHSGTTYKSFHRWAKAQGFQITRHGLRHTFATLRLQKGVPIWKVAGLLGDNVATVQANYGHHCPENLRDAVDL